MKWRLKERPQKIKDNLLLGIVVLYTGCVFLAAQYCLYLESERVPQPAYLNLLMQIEPTYVVRISINLADRDLLETLPGIGPVIAQRIIEYREANGSFNELEQIMNVSGIGKEKYAELKYFIEL